MDRLELYYLLKLNFTQNIGYVIGRRLLTCFGSAQAVFKASKSDILSVSQVGNLVYQSLHKGTDIQIENQIQNEINFIEQNDIHVLSIFDADYPQHLIHCLDAPFLIFTRGKIQLKNERVISIVGTRSLTKYGENFCETFIESISKYNPVIVSGLALGTDILVHKLAVKYNLQTIAILPTGLKNIYPKEHELFCNEICENGGLITEFWSDRFAEKENFVKRNRIIAGISMATVLIESAIKGGSLITTSYANDYNREVFALPGRVTDVYSKGCNMLIKKNEASILNSAEDVIQGLNWDVCLKPLQGTQTKMFLELTPSEQLIYNFLEERGKTFFDVIATSCMLTSNELSLLLLDMELNGIIKSLPGKFYDIK